ncbi:Peptidase C19, ubiquitin carboxyl-terminal hydrolase [Dillenia turbinata]|uniref:Ubiquitin carboxyl-terminal hydrolase n=1 Tax=Dillenia turbinata TaxID=194707 RepID=A0AAN8V7T3_9MAGN
MDGDNFADAAQRPLSDSDGNQRLYFVPYKWWKEAHDATLGDKEAKRGVSYAASPAPSSYASPMKLINTIFNSDIVLILRRVDDFGLDNEVGISGHDFALVHGDMWLHALKWHSDSKALTKDGKSFLAAEDDMSDVYPLQLRLSVVRETNTLGVKISKKDNATEFFKRACKIFSVESELRIWDFSGQTTPFLMNDKNKFPKDGQRQWDQEVLLELQVYGLSDSMKGREGKKDEHGIRSSNVSGSSCGVPLMINGSSGSVNSNVIRSNSWNKCGNSGEAGSLGLTGLQNLGNTCFMNSAIQCLAHTPKLVDYFHGEYSKEINHENPLGMNGEIALAFGDLLRKLWAPGAGPVAPKMFKSKLARFAPQFSGFNQHDSQELLAFLLDGLHEDLNRVKCKPYVEAKDGDGRPDEEVADEYWQYHLARNDSIIVDVCQGQYRSTLVCPVCKKVSVTFDPFMYLSLPLPSTAMRTMTLTVVSTDGTKQPSVFTISVPKNGRFKDLIEALSISCSLGVDENLLVAEIYNHSIIRYLEEPTDSLSLIRDEDRLVAYHLPKDSEKLVVFTHQKMEQGIHGKQKAFGIPLVSSLSSIVNGSDIRSLYLRILNPFLTTSKDVYSDDTKENNSALEVVTGEYGIADSVDEKELNAHSEADLEFYLTEVTNKNFRMGMKEPIMVTELPKRMNVHVSWPEKKIKQYDSKQFSSLPEVFKASSFAKRPQESVSLYKCLEAFLKEEPLGPEDMYCPSCKEHRQASKKLDLWRLPEILVIHLKRFSYSRYTKNKLETSVDFPIDDLNLSTYIAYKNGESSFRYMLYAISNHYGSMGGGHYTAFVNHGGGQWYDFDDSHVFPISEDKIKTSAAYVLFYRRVDDV